MPRRAKPLPPMDLADVWERYPALRQSLLSSADNCFLMARFELEGHSYNNRAQARGIVGHRCVAEILRTLKATGQVRMPVAEGLEILYEVSAQRDVPDHDVVVLPMAERRLLRIAIVKFCAENEFGMDKLLDVERRLFTTVTYDLPGGGTKDRLITGQPDALLRDPPDGAAVLDWKFSLQPPPQYHGKYLDPETGRPRGVDAGVSYNGYFQQRTYGLIVMKTFTSVARCTLREFYPLAGEVRTAVVYREDLEHIERELAILAELVDRALAGGSESKVWAPSPGRHCSFCVRPSSCPIAADVRAFEGGVATQAQAMRSAAEYVVAKRIGKTLHEALAAWVTEHGPIPVKSAKGRYELRYRRNRGGGRQFGMFVPETSDRGPDDPELAAAFAEAAERRRAAA